MKTLITKKKKKKKKEKKKKTNWFPSNLKRRDMFRKA
jgi:hypothetical protein